MRGPIQSLEVTCFLHATEDADKVAAAVVDAFSIQGEPLLEKMEGHFGNEITMMRFHLLGDEAQRAFSKLAASIPPETKAAIVGEIAQVIDEHSALFLRFDKQSVVQGRLRLGEVDPVRVKVKPRKFVMKGTAPEFYSRLFGA